MLGPYLPVDLTECCLAALPEADVGPCCNNSDPTGKPRILVATALANKMARGLWAMMTKQEEYRDPAQT